MDIKGKVALVTGCSRDPGLGMSIAQALAARGVRLMLTGGSNATVIAANIDRMRANGADVQGGIADLTDFAQTQALVADTRRHFGQIDMLIHCAGGRSATSIIDMSLAQWQQVIRVNLDAAFYLTKTIAPHMIARGHGRLVFMAGISGQAGEAERAHVVTAKGGIMSFVKSAASELGPHGITVNAISPGLIDTPRDDGAGIAKRLERARVAPLRRLGSRDEIAHACLFLVSDAAGFITGQTIAVNGGAYM